MVKSYAQVNGHQVVDWKKELQLLVDGKESKVDLKLVEYWDTCYVGQQSEMIERDGNEPTDNFLTALGTKFSSSVTKGDYAEALTISEMIDIRVTFLLQKRKEQMLAEIAEKEAELKELKAELKKF